MQLPVYILTKMDYQTCFGAEMLTESESCRLWTESLLHTNSLLYIGHIDALTSKFFMLEEISQEGLKDRFGTFKPANSLVTLRHILKLVTGLEDGSYLLSHASGDSSVSIYKSIPSCVRGAYDLHKAHSSLPKAPTSLSVPWVPVDPNILLPIHTNHCWPPCTFPPQEHLPASHLKEYRRSNPGPSLHPAASNPTADKTSKKNKGKRKNRLLRWRAKCTEWKAKATQQKKKT